MIRARNLPKEHPSLPYLGQEERLKVYNDLLTTGAKHLWSRWYEEKDLETGKMLRKKEIAPQKEKIQEILDILVPLTEKDPFFLAHLTSYLVATSSNKDLQIMTTYVNSLSSADGMPFSPGSKYFKPNLRYVSAAAAQRLEPKQAYQLMRLGMLKYSVPEYLNESRHFSRPLETALRKYLRYREVNLEMMRGIKKAGLRKPLMYLYQGLHLNPPNEIAAILRWPQKDRKIEFEKPAFDFSDLDDLQIAEKIREEKLPVLGVLGALPRKMSPVIAVALLEQASGNQAVILRKTFEDTGLLEDAEVKKLYEEKIREAKTALDRVENVSKKASEQVKKMLKTARAETRKEQIGDVGRIFLHIDFSPSMEGAVEYAKENGATIAEMVKDPKNNFRWGRFAEFADELPFPEVFEREAFEAILYGKTMGGGTDCFALYENSRKFGAEVDIFVSDGEHNMGDLTEKIRQYHERNPEVQKPKAIVLIRVRGSGPSAGSPDSIEDACEANGIPYAEMKPETLESPALVSEAVKTAIKGPMATIEAIMNTPLLTLPSWYYSI